MIYKEYKHIIKIIKTFIIFFIILIPNEGISKEVNREKVDGKIATIGKISITYSDLNLEIYKNELTLKKKNTIATNENYRQFFFKKLVEKSIFLQYKREHVISVSEEEIQKALDNILKKNNFSYNELISNIVSQKFNEEFLIESIKSEIEAKKRKELFLTENISFLKENVVRRKYFI